MPGILLLLSQALIYFGVMAALFRARTVLGSGAFLCALGVMHFLETYLAAVFFVQLPFGAVSPGSTVLFAGKLAIILMVYIREDAETVRQPIYGLLIGNFLIVALVLLLRLYTPPMAMPGYNADLTFVDQMGILMVWGSSLLFVDSIVMILLYERLRRFLPKSVGLRAGISLAVILSADQVAFFLGLRWVTGAPWEALLGGWIAKMGAAVVYAALLATYLRHFEKRFKDGPASLSDTFYKLTYRQKYEELLVISNKDAVTGAIPRVHLEVLGREAIERAASAHLPLSVAMIDIDNFKAINDRHGHLQGDEALRKFAMALRDRIRPGDMLFRYGGDEFVILFENMPHLAALDLTERIRDGLAARLESELHIPVTCSIGLATAPDDALDLTALLDHADKHLYRAKRDGRDRVVSDWTMA